MSRHRNVRNYAYEDEMSDDVYGHSVEEYDMCVSPSTAQQFMYNRGNDNHQSNLFSNYMSGRFGSVEEEQEEGDSEDEDHLSNSQDYRRPQLDPISEAKLSSCLDQLQSVLGDDCHEPTAVDAILKSNFDAEKALDYIFSKENKKDNSQKKSAKKQDSSLHHKLLKKNVAKSISNQRDTQMGASQHAKTDRQSSENNNSISQGSSLLSMPLSSIITEGRDNSSDEVKSDASKNQLRLTSLGCLMAGSQQESSTLTSMSEMTSTQNLSQSRDPLLSVSLKTLAEEQTVKPKSFQESWSTLSSLCDKNSSGDVLASTSLSSLAKQHDKSTSTKSFGLSGISLQELAKQMPSSLTKTSSSSKAPVDMLASTSLSSLAKQHDESTSTRPVGLSGVSLQELANQMPSSLPKMSHPSNEPVNMLDSMSLSSLAKQHDESTCTSTRPVGLSGISLQEFANQMPFSLTKTSLSSTAPVDMLSSTSLSSLAKQHGESTSTRPVGLSGISLQELANHMPSSLPKTNPSSKAPVDMLSSASLSSLAKQHDKSSSTKLMGLSGISLQDLAKQMPPSFTNQGKQFPTNNNNPMDVDMSSLGKEPSRDHYRMHMPAQNTQGLTQDSLFAASLSSLASLSLDSNMTRRSLKTSGMSHGLSDKNNSAVSALSILSDSHNSRILDGRNTPQASNEQTLFYPKQSNKKVRGSRCEENLLKVSPKSMKKKMKNRTHKISQSSLLLMHPSMFAVTLCRKSKRKLSFPDHLKSKRLCTSGCYGNSDIAAFNFMSPSPDDNIKMKQQQRFGVQHEKLKA